MTDFVANMSEADNVLHLYVEVRTLGEEKSKELQRGDNRNTHLMLHCPDVLPHSQRRCVHSGPCHSPEYSPVTPHRSGTFNKRLPPSRWSSRHTVNFQLPNHDTPKSPSLVARQAMLYGSLGQLFDVLTPDPGTPHQGPHGRLTYSNFIDRGSYQDLVRSPPSSAVEKLDVPSTPTINRKFNESHKANSEHGKTSVVRFGYVDKANVNTGSQSTSLCHCKTDKPSREIKEPVLLRKRNSDPGWHHDLEPLEDPIFNNYQLLQNSQMSPTSFKRSTLETVAKDATYKALGEFGSPELRHRFDSYCQENCCPNLLQHPQPQHFWSPSQSPILHQKTLTLPSQTPHSELNMGLGHSAVTGSHASEQFSSHAAHPSLCCHSFSQSQQGHWVENESSKLGSNFRSPLPARRPTAIHHTTSTSKFPTSTRPRTTFQPSGHLCPSEISCIPNTYSCIFKGSNKTCYNQAHTSFHARNMTSPENDTSPSPMPYQAESPILGSSRIRRTFYSEPQPHAHTHWRSSPKPRAGDQTPPTIAGYGHSPPKHLSSPKSLSLPASLNHTDLFHHTKKQSNVVCPNSNMGLSTQRPCELPQNIENLHGPSAERRDYQQVLDRSFRNSPEVTRRCIAGQHDNAVSRASRFEANSKELGDENQKSVNRVYADRKEQQPVKTTPKKMNLNSEPQEPQGPQEQPDSDTCQPLCEPIDSRAGTQVGRIHHCHMKISIV